MQYWMMELMDCRSLHCSLMTNTCSELYSIVNLHKIAILDEFSLMRLWSAGSPKTLHNINVVI